MDQLFDEAEQKASELAQVHKQNLSAVHFFQAALSYPEVLEFLVENGFEDLDNATKEIINALPTYAGRESAQLDLMRSNMTTGFYYAEFMEEHNFDTNHFDPVVLLYATACSILEMNIPEVYKHGKTMERVSELLTTIEKNHEPQLQEEPEPEGVTIVIQQHFSGRPSESEVKERMLGVSDIINSALAKGGVFANPAPQEHHINTGKAEEQQPQKEQQKDKGGSDSPPEIESVFKDAHEKMRYQRLPELLSQRVIAQPAAVEALSKAALRAKAGLIEKDKTQGAFMFTGPTGVGKTELAKAFAAVLRRPFIRFDMSDYTESHAVSKLISAPPGYVGHDPNGGALHKMVRANPNAVLLLDEVEKAHPDIYDVFLQILDNAKLKTASGAAVDFSNVTLIMTTNAGASDAARRGIGFLGTDFNSDAQEDALKRFFKPEFRNRLDGIIPFHALDKSAIRLILDKFIREMSNREFKDRGITAEFSEAAKMWLAENGHDPAMGARPLKRLIATQVKDQLTQEILFGALEKGGNVFFDLNSDKSGLRYDVRDSASSPASPSVH